MEPSRRVQRNPQADFTGRPQGDHRHGRGRSAVPRAAWQGGDHTRLEVVKNRTGQNRWKTDVETVQLVRELARMLPDHSIAPVLNRLGIRSAKGHSWTQLRVRNFRSVHQIAIYREGERAERLILYEAASRLGVSKMTVIRLIRDRLLPARQACVG